MVPSTGAGAATKKAPAPQADELAQATSELEAFNRRTHDAAQADSDPQLAIESVERQLKVVEATTPERVSGGFAQYERALALLEDAKAKLDLAKKPRGGATPAPAAALAELEQRRSAAFDAATLREGDYLANYAMGVGDIGDGPDAVGALLAFEFDARASALKAHVRKLKSSDAKTKAQAISSSLNDAKTTAYSSVGQQRFSYVGGMSSADCKGTTKDDLAWQLVLDDAATFAAMSKVPPWSVVNINLPENSLGNDPGGAAKGGLYDTMIESAAHIDTLKGCGERSSLTPTGAGGLVRTGLAAGVSVAKAATEVQRRIAGLDQYVYEQKSAASPSKSQRAEVDKHARAGASALGRYKAALARKVGEVEVKDLLLARDEFNQAQARGSELTKQRTALRKAEDRLMGEVRAADDAINSANSALKQARTAATSLRSVLAQQAKEVAKDPSRRAEKLRLDAVASRVQDAVTRADAGLKVVTNAGKKLEKQAGLGALAGYPKRVIAADKEDTALATLLAQVDAQLKDASDLLKPGTGSCDLHKVDWKNFKYDFGKLRNGSFGDCDPDGEHSDNHELDRVEYADLDGDGRAEAFVVVWSGGCGHTSIVYWQVHGFGADAQCSPLPAGVTEPIGMGVRLSFKNKVLTLDWPDDTNTPPQRFAFEKGKLQRRQ